MPSPARPAGELKVMTLNLAHGRSNGLHQALESRRTIQKHLDAAAALIRRVGADVVALQEADGPSLWSGRFNHVEYLARAAGYPFYIRAENVKGLKFSYGAAMLSRLPLRAAEAVTFAPSPPTPTKGFVAARVRLPGPRGREVEVVSLHLDFLRQSVRRRQAEEIIRAFAHHARPLIVMGDFNSQWAGRRTPLQLLAAGLNLRAYKPEAKLVTFPRLRHRLDWILVSPDFEFVRYEAEPDVVSDHLAVVAQLRLRGPARKAR